MLASQSNKKKPAPSYKNPLEAVRDLGVSTVKSAVDSVGKIGTGMIDQLIGNYDEDDDENQEKSFVKEIKEAKKNLEKKQQVFNFQEYHETTLVRRHIAELTEQIRKEIEALKKADQSLLNDVRDIEKIALNDLPEKPGIYHVRFLEIVLNILRALRAKVGESRTWLQAMITRKKKRGSLFAARSKKQGTQYSLSQELQSARSVQ